MADITKIKLPSGSTYDIKDASAFASASASGGTITFTKRDGTTTSVTVSATVNALTVDEVTELLNA